MPLIRYSCHGPALVPESYQIWQNTQVRLNPCITLLGDISFLQFSGAPTWTNIAAIPHGITPSSTAAVSPLNTLKISKAVPYALRPPTTGHISTLSKSQNNNLHSPLSDWTGPCAAYRNSGYV